MTLTLVFVGALLLACSLGSFIAGGALFYRLGYWTGASDRNSIARWGRRP